MKKSTLAFFVLAWFLLSCKEGDKKIPFNDEQKNAMVDSVRQLSDAMWKSFESMDADGGTKYWATDAVFASEDTIFFTSKSSSDIIKTWFEPRTSQTIRWADGRISALSPDIVVRAQRGSFSATMKKGSSWSLKFTMTEIWMRKEGKWTLINIHQAVENPPCK